MQNPLLRDHILHAFYQFPKTSTYVCFRMIKNVKYSPEVQDCINDLVKDGLLIEHKNIGRFPCVYEISQEGQLVLSNTDLPTLTPYEKKVQCNITSSELEFVTNQEYALLFMKKLNQKNKYPCTYQIQDHLKLTYIDTITVLAKLVQTKEIEPIGLLWKLCSKEFPPENNYNPNHKNQSN